MSTKSAMIRARIEPKTKSEAESILKKLGLNPTDAISMFYYQIILKRAIPFSIDLENEDIEENYAKVESDNDLKSILNL